MNAGPLGSPGPSGRTASPRSRASRYSKKTGHTVTYAFQITTTAAPVRFVGTVSARNPTGVDLAMLVDKLQECA